MPKPKTPNSSLKVVEMRLTAAIAEKRIKEIALTTENVILGTHALKRMAERGIDDIDVFRVLRSGYIDELPEKTAQNNGNVR